MKLVAIHIFIEASQQVLKQYEILKKRGWLDRRGRLEIRRNLVDGRGGRMVKREEGESLERK